MNHRWEVLEPRPGEVRRARCRRCGVVVVVGWARREGGRAGRKRWWEVDGKPTRLRWLTCAGVPGGLYEVTDAGSGATPWVLTRGPRPQQEPRTSGEWHYGRPPNPTLDDEPNRR